MKTRIAYYVVALAISQTAFTACTNFAVVARDANAIADASDAAANAFAAANRDLSSSWADADAATHARLEATYATTDANAAIGAANTARLMAAAVSLAAFAGAYILDKRRGGVKLRIAYYVVALAISLAAFTGAFGYAAAYARIIANADGVAAYDDVRRAREALEAALGDGVGVRDGAARLGAAYDSAEAAYDSHSNVGVAVTAYGMAAAVSLAAFAGAYILDKRRAPPAG